MDLDDIRKHEGWVVILSNGEIMYQEHHQWCVVMDQTEDVVRLGLVKGGRLFWLPEGKRDYIQAISACAALGLQRIEVLSQYIGFTEGNRVFRLRVTAKHEDCLLEIE